MWDSVPERMALLELFDQNTLKKRRAQELAFETLSDLSWTRATGRRDEIRLVAERQHELIALLDRVWPRWRLDLEALKARGYPPTPEGWERLRDARRAEGIPVLPERLNRHTAAALAAPHSKAKLTTGRRAALGKMESTHDGLLRLRPSSRLIAQTKHGAVDLLAVCSVFGEVAIPERVFLDGLTLQGDLRAVLFVENLGAWRDLVAPSGWLLAHVPGWNTAMALRLLVHVAHVPVVHFGDLDPNGTRIYQHLCEHRPDLLWFVPPFWAELVESHGISIQWPTAFDLRTAPALVHDLMARGLWLEQESIVLDPRIPVALEELLQEVHSSV